MLLFCLGTQDTVQSLKEIFGDLVNYADDILVLHDDTVPAMEVIQTAKNQFKGHIGMIINDAKCDSTQGIPGR